MPFGSRKPVERGDGREDVGGRDARRADALQLGGEHVQQHLGIGGGVEVATLLADQHLGELGRVGQVAVVAEADAVRRVDVERLRLGDPVAAGGRIADVADADVALEVEHGLLVEDVPDQARALVHRQQALARGDDARGVLATMLQHGQRVVDALVDRRRADDSDQTAHDGIPISGQGWRGRRCAPRRRRRFEPHRR
jgi:hypothetical protein